VTVKVKVLQPFQVALDGKIYWPGDTADVPDAVAKQWLVSSWVEPVGAAAKRAKADIDAAAVISNPTDEFGNNPPKAPAEPAEQPAGDTEE
jgi:hypothetical protein